jgi:predicted Zn-dependent protease
MHFRFAKTLGLLAALMLFAGLASAQEHVMTHKDAGVQFSLPAGWQSDADGDRLLVHSPDKSVAIVFFVATEDNFEAAINAMTDEVDKIIDNVKVTNKGQEGEHNGMPMYSVSGTGTMDDKPVAWDVTLLAAKRPIIVMGFAEPASWKKNEAAYNKLVESIHKVE